MVSKRWICSLFCIVMGSIAMAQSVFDMPKLFPQHRQYLTQFVTALQQNNLLAAETAARAAVKIFPNDANWHYNVGCVCARDQRPEEALEWLVKAVDLGFTDLRQLKEDADLAGVRQLPAFAKLLKHAETQRAAPQRNATLSAAFTDTVLLGNEATVTAKNTQWNWDPLQGGYMTSLFALVGDRKVQAEQYNGPYAEQIRAWIEDGTASGNAGELYVNRDEDVTQIATEKFPLLTSVLYDDVAQKARAHVGAANGLFSSGLVSYPVVGTSVVALARSAYWRSLPRLVATDATADQLAFRLAAANQLYLYDASPDYSTKFKGDLLLAAQPHVIVTCNLVEGQGDAVEANRQMAELILAGLAAMAPDVKTEMYRRGLLVPTMQMLLRKSVKGAESYTSAAAHPVVFDPKMIDGLAFVTAAHALTRETLPVIFQIVSRRETTPRRYIDYFDVPTSERISDTPWSIKRVVRGVEWTRKITVSAASAEPGVSYQWFVTSGDPEKIRIRPLTKDGALVTLEVDYHGVFEQQGIATRHVDIACVALRKGAPASAPHFVSFRYLANERRTYTAQGKIQQVDYTIPESGYVYEDPLLSAFKNWKDDYQYDAAGRMLGWTRTLFDGTIQHFDGRGRRVVETHADGSAKRVVEVKYFPRTNKQSNATTSPAIELLQADDERIQTL